jgi:hypothetical protein
MAPESVARTKRLIAAGRVELVEKESFCVREEVLALMRRFRQNGDRGDVGGGLDLPIYQAP